MDASLLIAQVDLSVTQLITGAMAQARPRGGSSTAVSEFVRGQDVFETVQGPHDNRSQRISGYSPFKVAGPVVADMAQCKSVCVSPNDVPPLDPGAVDLRDSQYRRKESGLPPIWNQLPPVAHAPAAKVHTQIRTIAIGNSRELKGTTIDLFC